MARKPVVNIAVEGDLDEAVLRRALASVGIRVERQYVQNGKDRLRENVPRYNQAAKFADWVVLVDLNIEAECAPVLVASWLSHRNPRMQLRVAVREVESWLLADRAEMARFLSVAQGKIPLNPEQEEKPKDTLIGIARSSRRRAIREGLVPAPSSSAKQGPGYVSQLIEFVEQHWDPQRASKAAPSLARTLLGLGQWGGGISR